MRGAAVCNDEWGYEGVVYTDVEIVSDILSALSQAATATHRLAADGGVRWAASSTSRV